MPVITVNGPIGCGSVTIGRMVAEKLNIEFVDRLVFTQAATMVRAPVEALINKEQRVARFRDRLGSFVHNMLERSAVSGHMYASGPWPPDAYAALAVEQAAKTATVPDKEFIDATSTVVNDLYRAGDVVIIGRGANVILGGLPGVLHVGLMAPDVVRTETLIRWESMEREEAEILVEELEQTRVKYFRKFFKVHPSEPSLYHMILNMGKLHPDTAAQIIVQAAEDLESIGEGTGDQLDASEILFSGWGEQGKQ